MTDIDAMRDECAAQLCALAEPNGPLHLDSPRTTARLYARNFERLTFHTKVIERYLVTATLDREAR